jgi:release factor glutamine methyltransferase
VVVDHHEWSLGCIGGHGSTVRRADGTAQAVLPQADPLSAGTVGRVTAAVYDDLVLRLRAAGCVFAEDEARLLLDAAAGDALETLVARRVAGEPVEYVVGRADFAGIRVALDPGVFIPRQRTAYLVELAASALVSRLPSRRLVPRLLGASAGTPQPAVVVDLCCGSGALGLALADGQPDIELHAADLDPVAVACARRNLEPIGATVHHGDLDAPLPDRLRGRVDVIVANVPYVPSAAIALMPPESRDHEPRDTVDGGADGLDVVRRLAALAPRWLAPGGRAFVETGTDQAAAAADAFAEAGLQPHVHHDEDRGATVVAAHDARITGAG